MKKFTVEQYGEAKVVAKEFGINSVGKKKQDLVDLVNEAIAKKEAEKVAKPAKKEKWYANGYGFNPSDVVIIESKTIEKAGETKEILQGRKASIIGPSTNEGMVKAFLFDEKTGQLLNCPITLEIAKINKEETQIVLVA
ncbi:hypothetical protein D3C81_384470 [compost metagenome]